jgi:hypothetical protein
MITIAVGRGVALVLVWLSAGYGFFQVPGDAAAKFGCRTLRTADGAFVFREVRVCEGGPEPVDLTSVCKERLAALSATRPDRLVDVLVSTSAEELDRSVLRRVAPSRDFGAGFDRTIEALRLYGSPVQNLKGPLVRCSAQGGAVRITAARMDGAKLGVERVAPLVAGTKDPQTLRLGSEELELLWVEEESGSNLPYRAVHFSALAKSNVSCAVCAEALARLAGTGRKERIHATLRIRRDPWFDGGAFPLVYRFHAFPGLNQVPGPMVGVPTVEDYYNRSAETQCWLAGRDGGAGCVYKGAWVAGSGPL